MISNSEFLWFKNFEFVYNIMIVEHSDCMKTYKIIQWIYYWFMMHDFVRKYVWFYLIYIWKKTWHAKKQDVLWFLSVLMQQWKNILIDFIIDLLNNNNYMNIMIVVDQFMKMKHMIFLKLLNIIEVVKIFTWNVFKLYELFDMIISDCESQFVAIFWKTLCMQLEIDL